MRVLPVRVADTAQTQAPNASGLVQPDSDAIGAQLAAARSQLLHYTESMQSALPVQLGAYIEQTSGLLNRLTCRIAIIGQVKAGKSTFINAFVGRPNLLPTHVSPWTTAVTHLHFGGSHAPEGTEAKFTFFDEQEWDKLVVGGGRIRDLTAQFVPGFEVDLLEQHVRALRQRSELRLGEALKGLLGTTHDFSELKPDILAEYVCAGEFDGSTAKQAAGKYSDVVKKADLYFPSGKFAFPTTVIDTPGTNDPFLVRDEITRQSLDAADMYIVVLTARQALSSADVALLRILHGLNKERVLIFINRIDELSNVADDCDDIIDDVRLRLGTELPGSQLRIIAGSALWAQSAREGRSIDSNSRGARNLLAYAARRGLNKLSAATDDPQHVAPSMNAMQMRCSGLPELSSAISEMMMQSHAGHVMGQVAATLRELAQVGPQILLRELKDLEVENQRGGHEFEAAEVEYQAIASDVRDSERALQAIHTLQVDMEARTQQMIDDNRASIEDVLSVAVEDFSVHECTSLAQDLVEFGRKRTWTSRPSDLRRLLEATYIKHLRQADEHLKELENGTVARLRSVVAMLNIEGVIDEPGQRDVDVRPLPLGALRRVIALDLGEPWWKRWWSGARSDDEYVAALDRIIRSEFTPIVSDMAAAAHVQLTRRRTAILSRLTMLSLSMIEAFQDLTERRARRLQELASERDETVLARRKAEREALMEKLRAHVALLRKIAEGLENGTEFKSMKLS